MFQSLQNRRALGSNPLTGSGSGYWISTMTNCRSPWMTTLNASLSKKISITERVYAQLQVDVLNAANHPLFFFNPNTGFKAYNSFNTASLTNASVPAFTNQSTFGIVNQPNSALMARVALVSIRLFW